MSGSFFGLNIAKSGLFASQRALNVIGHNIANVNTPGYSRQRVEVTESDPLSLASGQGMIGTGVDTQHITNVRDEFLDLKYRNEFQAFGEWEARAGVLKDIEVIMNEPTDTGIRKVMDQYFSALQQLSENPEDLTVRALVRERGIALAKSVNHMGNQLEKEQQDLDFNVKTVVGEINGYADQIADLNEQIIKYELDGSNANDLRDQRNLTLDKLSELIKIDTIEDKNGGVKVMTSGNQLVSQNGASHLKTKTRELGQEKNKADVKQLCDVVWEYGGSFKPTGGKLKGYIDARDNISGSEKGVPYYMDKLNEFAKTFSTQINNIHKEGYGLNGQHGVDFFQDDGEITATNMRISDEIDKDWSAIAASSTYAGLPGGRDNAIKMNQLKNDADMFAWGKPEDFMKSLISNLGVDSQQAKNLAENQKVLIGQVENKRQSISSVSLDEEMANMIRFQHSYQANARMITTMDSMLETIINKMGLVGR